MAPPMSSWPSLRTEDLREADVDALLLDSLIGRYAKLAEVQCHQLSRPLLARRLSLHLRGAG